MSTGKIVLLKNPKMRHLRLAEKVAGTAQGLQYQEELLKQLLFKVDDREVRQADLVDLDDLFEVRECVELYQVLGKLLGQGAQEAKVEQVFGGQ